MRRDIKADSRLIVFAQYLTLNLKEDHLNPVVRIPYLTWDIAIARNVTKPSVSLVVIHLLPQGPECGTVGVDFLIKQIDLVKKQKVIQHSVKEYFVPLL